MKRVFVDSCLLQANGHSHTVLTSSNEVLFQASWEGNKKVLHGRTLILTVCFCLLTVFKLTFSYHLAVIYFRSEQCEAKNQLCSCDKSLCIYMGCLPMEEHHRAMNS